MRYMVFSDIHSNLSSLEEVYKFFKREKFDRVLILGDFVGYGASPNEVISLIKKIDNSVAIAGNHDWGVIGKFPLEYFNKYAQEAIVWTKENINSVSVDFLNKLGLVYEEDGLSAVHSSLYKPENFFYIYREQDAQMCFDYMKNNLCFVGHTHYPGVFLYNKRGIQYLGVVEKLKIDLENNKYVINVGSVGQPRDGDSRSVFCIYDKDKNTIDFVRLSYNIDESVEKIKLAGLPEFLGLRLYKGY